MCTRLFFDTIWYLVCPTLNVHQAFLWHYTVPGLPNTECAPGFSLTLYGTWFAQHWLCTRLFFDTIRYLVCPTLNVHQAFLWHYTVPGLPNTEFVQGFSLTLYGTWFAQHWMCTRPFFDTIWCLVCPTLNGHQAFLWHYMVPGLPNTECAPGLSLTLYGTWFAQHWMCTRPFFDTIWYLVCPTLNLYKAFL